MATRNLVALVLPIAVLAAACGELRKRPLVPGVDGGGGFDVSTEQPILQDALGGEVSTFDAPPEVVTNTCVPGAACAPANPCREGQITCPPDGGTATCAETQRAQANGTVCGTNMVCSNGTCGACAAGTDCMPMNRPCRTGTIVCTTGTAVCTESDNRPNGTSCGTGMVCQAGACVTCQSGASCTPTNPCHVGTLDCSTGAAVCTDTNANLPAGTSCGTDRVCSAQGTCTACMAGASCAVPGRPCRTGATTCNTGAPTCVESGNVADGSSCGSNMVCSNGSCVSCTAGLSCTPTNPCRTGMTSCSPSITCTMTANMLPNGTTCGTDRVCNAGTCSACTAGAACQPANVCKIGATSCATGSSVCAESANLPNGTPCGSNLVCMSGSCATCSAGSACTPTNPCHTGTLSCTTGSPVCTDTTQSQPDGTSCGTNLVCRTGMCVSCVAGQTCQPANPCKYGMTSCSTGTSVCAESGNKPVGTLCGAAQSCSNGVKTNAQMCNAAQQCLATMTTCPSGGCNAGGTDCASCPNGETACPGQGCRNLTTDPANCGTCGNRCPDPPLQGSGSPVCVASNCDVICNTGYLHCGGGSRYCEKRHWGFENGDEEGFKILRNDYPMAVRSITASTANPYSGKYSLAIGIDVRGSARGFEIGLYMCGRDGYVPSNGQVVSAWFYLAPDVIGLPAPPPVHENSYFGEHLYTERANGGNIPYFNKERTWFRVVTPIEQLGSQLYQIAVEGYFNSDGSSRYDWKGTVYVDDITIEPPIGRGPL
jgi:hypothetical protein